MGGMAANAGFLGTGASLGAWAGGIGAGFAAGSLLNSALGGNQTGGMIGSGVGALGGAALGTPSGSTQATQITVVAGRDIEHPRARPQVEPLELPIERAPGHPQGGGWWVPLQLGCGVVPGSWPSPPFFPSAHVSASGLARSAANDADAIEAVREALEDILS